MDTLRKLFVAYVSRIIQRGEDATAIVDREVGMPWRERGLIDAVHRFDLGTGTGGEAFLLATAFEAGAMAALRQARTILSDPAIRGNEALALDMIAAGHSHADVLARINSRRGNAPEIGVVVNLGDRRKST